MQPGEVSYLTDKEQNIHDHLTQQLDLCYEHIDKNKHSEAYNKLVRHFESPQYGNINILRHLIYRKDDIQFQPLLKGSNRDHVEALRGKTVLLLISDLKPFKEELKSMEKIYAKKDSNYEIVWVPVIDKCVPWTDDEYKELQLRMPWHTIYDPKDLEPAFITYIKDVWKFSKEMILVVLDPRGNVVCQNALNMYLIWGNDAFPFTAMKEEALWSDETWGLELFFNNKIETKINDWISQEKYICVYGGEKLEWIREFIDKAKEVAHKANIDLKIIYAGKSNATEKTNKIAATIQKEGLSDHITAMEYFWVRLECMLHSKLQQGKMVKDDQIMKEVTPVLSYDGSDQVWATIWFGSEMTRAKGDAMLDSLKKFDDWQEDLRHKRFIPALEGHLRQNEAPHHRNRIILPGLEGGIPERVVCTKCGTQMEKYFMYHCCTD